MGMTQLLSGVITGGDENAIAAVDVPRDGTITGVEWCVQADLDADQEIVIAQLGFGSVQNFGNDARSVISEVGAQTSVVTSGFGMVIINEWRGNLDIPVAAGERLYLHVTSASGVTGSVRSIVHYSYDEPRSRTRRV